MNTLRPSAAQRYQLESPSALGSGSFPLRSFESWAAGTVDDLAVAARDNSTVDVLAVAPRESSIVDVLAVAPRESSSAVRIGRNPQGSTQQCRSSRRVFRHPCRPPCASPAHLCRIPTRNRTIPI